MENIEICLQPEMEINQLGRWYLISEKRCGSYMPLNYLTMRLKGLFIIEQ